MACKRCQHISTDGDQCKRKASCHVDCYDFCWQHAEKWSQTKGCTGKKLYQYRKKTGPKTGKCGPKEMIGASGRCVKRTPANLKAKKEALVKRKLKGKKAKVDSDEEPFIEIEESPEEPFIEIEESPEEPFIEIEESPESLAVSSEDELPFIEIEESPEAPELTSDLRECRDNVSNLRREYINEKKGKETVVKFFDTLSKEHRELQEQKEQELQDLRQECANQKQDLQSAYNFQLAQANAKEQDLTACKYDLGQLQLQYESQKETISRELDELDQRFHRERALVEQMSERVQNYQKKLQEVETEFKEHQEADKEALSGLRQSLQEHQRVISENEREINSLKADYDRLEQRLRRQGIDEGRLDSARVEYDLLIAAKEEELTASKAEFANLYREYEEQKDECRTSLDEIRSRMLEQRNALTTQEEEMKECERGLEELNHQQEQQRQASRKELGEVKSEILLQTGKLQEIESDLSTCQLLRDGQQGDFEEQQASSKKEFDDLKEKYEIQQVEASEKESGIEGFEKEIRKLQDQLSILQSTREQDREEYKEALVKVQDHYEEQIESTAEDERKTASLEIETQKNMAKVIEQDCNLEIQEHKEQLANFQQLYNDIEGTYKDMISNLTQQLQVAQQKVAELTEQEDVKSARVLTLENELGGLKQQSERARERGKKRYLEIKEKQKSDKEQLDLEQAEYKEEERRKEEEWEQVRESERVRHEENMRYLTELGEQ